MIRDNNPLLLNVTYVKEDKNAGVADYFEVIYRDDNGEVKTTTEPAEVDIYFVKEKYRTFAHNKPEERMERLDKRRVLYSKIREEIKREMGDDGKQLYRYCMESKNYGELDRFYLWPYSFRADFEPEFYFMDEWFKKYPMPPSVKLSKAYLDVEVDQIDNVVDLDDIQNTASAPVNCVTVLIEDTRECYTFILEPKEPSRLGYTPEEFTRRKQYYETQLTAHHELMKNTGQFTDNLNKEFSKAYGNFSYRLRNYRDELELIVDVFRLINTRKPNFCLMWNMRFDIQYLMYRLRWLVGSSDVARIICHPDFKAQSCFFKIDKQNFQLEKQFDYFYCSSYTQYICQMRLYASIRKSQAALKSISLNYISDRELGDKKVDYQSEMNFVDFMYLDWPTFITYNIKDVLLQYGIEQRTHDILTYYLRSMSNCTPYRKIFRETQLLRNVRELYFNKQGWVQGNNINIVALRRKWREERELKKKWSNPEEFQESTDSDSDKTSFKGAIMAHPLMNDNVGVPIMGLPSNVLWENIIDMDMSAFYPSIKIVSNMDPISLIGKVHLNNEQFTSGEFTNNSLNQTYEETDKNGNIRKVDLSGEVINTYVSGNSLTFAYNWLGLPSVSEMYKIIQRK